MLFVGEYNHSLDAKNRLFIPAKYREMLGPTFYVTRKIMEHCLAIYSEAEWDKLTEKLNTQPDSRVGGIKQFLYSKTISVSPDSQGRVVLPPDLLAYASVDKNAVIIGVGDHLQIWSDTLWAEKQNAMDTVALAQQLQDLGL